MRNCWSKVARLLEPVVVTRIGVLGSCLCRPSCVNSFREASGDMRKSAQWVCAPQRQGLNLQVALLCRQVIYIVTSSLWCPATLDKLAEVHGPQEGQWQPTASGGTGYYLRRRPSDVAVNTSAAIY